MEREYMPDRKQTTRNLALGHVFMNQMNKRAIGSEGRNHEACDALAALMWKYTAHPDAVKYCKPRILKRLQNLPHESQYSQLVTFFHRNYITADDVLRIALFFGDDTPFVDRVPNPTAAQSVSLISAAKFALRHGANPDSTDSGRPREVSLPLIYKCAHRMYNTLFQQAFQLLFKAGASLTRESSSPVLHDVLDTMFDSDAEDTSWLINTFGNNNFFSKPLRFRAATEIADIFVKTVTSRSRHVPLELQDLEGLTLLHKIFDYKTHFFTKNNTHIASTLLRKGADPDIRTRYGETALHVAAHAYFVLFDKNGFYSRRARTVDCIARIGCTNLC